MMSSRDVPRGIQETPQVNSPDVGEKMGSDTIGIETVPDLQSGLPQEVILDIASWLQLRNLQAFRLSSTLMACCGQDRLAYLMQQRTFRVDTGLANGRHHYRYLKEIAQHTELRDSVKKLEITFRGKAVTKDVLMARFTDTNSLMEIFAAFQNAETSLWTFSMNRNRTREIRKTK
ncbi:hypothetical protein EJ08DRAFT_657895 [Tothia fuscella]|uniref:F-box domain-containing protein n=1 Tax=Tothia fuscella TaxID=1048955 RepID=A0A9P4NWR0_9PEZI|nr:hypothetical protein EJ08DRAFT_657895 [Tothia fuscella]